VEGGVPVVIFEVDFGLEKLQLRHAHDEVDFVAENGEVD
jgi:hypothetical protein